MKGNSPLLLQLFNYASLTLRLVVDRRVNLWLKLFLVGLPLAYFAVPVTPEIPDIIPLIGLLDDLLFLGITSLVFVALCPRQLVHEHQLRLGMRSGLAGASLERYRNPDERRDLASGFALMVLILVIAGAAVGTLLVIVFGLSYVFTNWQRGKMLANAVQVSERQLSHIHTAWAEAQAALPSLEASVFVVQDPLMNAYTFGYHEPYTIVLTSALVEKLGQDEIQAVIGHELGHALFGHTLLISIMATSVTGLERLLFFRWSRSCEYSADAIALQAMDGDPKPLVSALLKLSSGMVDADLDLQAFLEQLDRKSQRDATAAEFLSTHPFINNRIRHILELSAKNDAPSSVSIPSGARLTVKELRT